MTTEADHDLHRGVYEELIRVAQTADIAFYSEIAPLAGLDMGQPEDRDAISGILGRISSHEHALGHPMLSAVVIAIRSNVPRRGFFELARQLGLLVGDDRSDETRFFFRELSRVHDHWAEN